MALAVALLAAAPAAAHVDVLPTAAPHGEAREFTIRVPTERDLPTTRVRVEFPPQVTVFSLGPPPPDWSVRGIRAPDGRLRAVVYTGGRIPPGRYADFSVLGTPFELGTALWKADQTYADGQVKRWTGPPATEEATAVETGPEEPGPAAAVEVVEPGSVAEEGAAAAPGGEDAGSGAAIWLGVIAIGIAALAALGVGMLWSTRPARLPGEEPEP